eukprot:CAMPEP_0115209432 /NCGR_PEP_ID=MMETSP0270-20121206/21734_1 /TAXON_ID=71861 /ORGANISM="Scrippsiella trochoidea, Strain CCMP3099" /LENGTH=236 /DNA_ID=CAMNT_0002623067 /DNA_START=128 /DNA_END=838 /DNA_ORIENTATION=-
MEIKTSTVSVKVDTSSPTSDTTVGEVEVPDEGVEVVRAATLSRQEWQSIFGGSRSFGTSLHHVIGSWTTDHGTFHIVKRPSKDEVMFRQGALWSIMTLEGRWWCGEVQDDLKFGRVCGELRLRREGRCLRSNFKKEGVGEDWGADSVARKGGWHRAADKLARRQRRYFAALQAEQPKRVEPVAQAPRRPSLALGWAFPQAPQWLSMGRVASEPAARTSRSAAQQVLLAVRRVRSAN